MRQPLPSLDAILLEELTRAWHNANWTYLGEALRPPVLGLCDDRSKLGMWVPGRRAILLDRTLVREAPWEQVLEVLRHEMAHQYAHEVLGARDEAPHGHAFRYAAKRLAVDRLVTGHEQLDGTDDKVVRRVRKLLSLAQSANRHEAEVAAAKAQKLMLEHNISLVGAPQRYTSRIIGPRKLRFQRWEHLLASTLAEYFFVDLIWVPVFVRSKGRMGTAAEVMGTPSNLDMAEYVHRYVSATARRLWEEWAPTRTVRRRTDKGDFLNGVMLGFRKTLAQERDHQEQTGLVWVGDPGLDDHYEARHPKVQRRRRSRIRGSGAFQAGHSAGSDIVLHRPLAEGPGGGTRGLLEG